MQHGAVSILGCERIDLPSTVRLFYSSSKVLKISHLHLEFSLRPRYSHVTSHMMYGVAWQYQYRKEINPQAMNCFLEKDCPGKSACCIDESTLSVDC